MKVTARACHSHKVPKNKEVEIRQEIVRMRKLQRCPRAKTKDAIKDRDPVLRPVVPAV